MFKAKYINDFLEEWILRPNFLSIILYCWRHIFGLERTQVLLSWYLYKTYSKFAWSSVGINCELLRFKANMILDVSFLLFIKQSKIPMIASGVVNIFWRRNGILWLLELLLWFEWETGYFVWKMTTLLRWITFMVVCLIEGIE